MIKDFCLVQSKLRTGYKPVQGSTLMEPVYAPCLTWVGETPSSRGYGYVVFSIDHFSKTVIVYAQSNTRLLTQDVKASLVKICTPINIKDYAVATDPSLVIGLPQDDLLLLEKLDDLFYSSTFISNNFVSLKLQSRDTNNVHLINYLESIGRCRDEYANPIQLSDVAAPAVVRKWASTRKQVDWNLFWNSSILTDEEKDNCRMDCNLQVAYSNKDRDIRKIIERQFYVDYPSRNWVFNILHGVPGSGKTTMIMEDICALNNIPCLYINGDARASINKMIQLVGPSKNAQGVVELTLEESVWGKCLKHNIPLVVFLDEIDTMNTLELKNLGTLATSGKATINTSHYNNRGKSIYYFGAFNPGSINASEFPDSFDDRLMWFSVPKVSQKEKIDYRVISSNSQLNISNKQNIIQDYLVKLEGMKAEHPELESVISNLSFNFTNINLNRCNEDALKWYCDRAIENIIPQPQPVSFKEGEFNNIYIDDVGTVAYVPEVDAKITKFFDKMNEKLAELTRGIQTTKRNRNSTITIADRCYDVFKDLIFTYSSVKEAFNFTIMNRLPEGFVLNVPGATTKAGVDGAPKAIYDALYNYLEKDIEDLHNYLFKTSNSFTSEACYKNNITMLQHVAAQVNSSTASTGPDLSDMVEDVLNGESSGSVILDEWGEVSEALDRNATVSSIKVGK